MSSPTRYGPAWLGQTLQGVSFWVGHRRSIYSAYELSEGALVAELCNLLHAHISENYRLRCEELYKKFLPKGVCWPQVGPKARVDLSIWERFRHSDSPRFKQRILYAIEVKRARASTAEIDQDLYRLAGIVQNSDGIRAILCVISEGTRPKRFTTTQGTRKIGDVPIPNTNCVYQVIVVKKAAEIYGDRDRGHYACAIEHCQASFAVRRMPAGQQSRRLMRYLGEFKALGRKGAPLNKPELRQVLCLYAQLAEAGGMYEGILNTMRVAQLKSYNLWPFQHLVRVRHEPRAVIGPNANAMFRHLAKVATAIGMTGLAHLLEIAFRDDIRNGMAHADYVLDYDGPRLRRRSGGQPINVSLHQVQNSVQTAMFLFELLQDFQQAAVETYRSPRTIIGRFSENPPMPWTIELTENRAFRIPNKAPGPQMDAVYERQRRINDELGGRMVAAYRAPQTKIPSSLLSDIAAEGFEVLVIAMETTSQYEALVEEVDAHTFWDKAPSPDGVTVLMVTPLGFRRIAKGADFRAWLPAVDEIEMPFEDRNVFTFGKTPEMYASDFEKGLARMGGPGRHPSYFFSYQLSARTLIAAGKANGTYEDTALPVFYLQRHATELLLKRLLSWCHEIVNIDSKTRTIYELKKQEIDRLSRSHNLKLLLEDLERIAFALGHEPPVQIRNLVEEIIRNEPTETFARYERSEKNGTINRHVGSELILPVVEIQALLETAARIALFQIDQHDSFELQLHNDWDARTNPYMMIGLDDVTKWITLAGAVVGGVTGALTYWSKVSEKHDRIKVGFGSLSPPVASGEALHVLSQSDHKLQIHDYGFVDESGRLLSLPDLWANSLDDRDDGTCTRGTTTLEKRGEIWEVAYVRLRDRQIGAYAMTVGQTRRRVNFCRTDAPSGTPADRPNDIDVSKALLLASELLLQERDEQLTGLAEQLNTRTVEIEHLKL
uniref:Uncharacterized protein n=1 Tax=Tanacetum cinerariifolium TaxID=118510 RepID=A0A699GM84_TANCI|nr:hypothetical protein [Tanacetum cinerariifolium]